MLCFTVVFAPQNGPKVRKVRKSALFNPFLTFWHLERMKRGGNPRPHHSSGIRRTEVDGGTGRLAPGPAPVHTAAPTHTPTLLQALAPARAEIREFKALAPARAGVRVYGKEVILLKRIPWGTHGAAARLLSPPTPISKSTVSTALKESRVA